MKLVWQIIYPIAVYEILTAGIFLLFPDLQALAAQGISAAVSLVILGILYARGAADGRFYTGRTVTRQDETDRFRVPKAPAARFLQCVCIGSVSCILFNNLIVLSGLEQVFTGYRNNMAQIYLPPVWQQIVLAGLLVPAAEELVFRGMIYGTLRQRFSFPAAMIVSASLFGLYHGSVVQGLYGICMGLVLAESYEHRGGFWAAVTVHAAANLTAVFAEHFA